MILHSAPCSKCPHVAIRHFESIGEIESGHKYYLCLDCALDKNVTQTRAWHSFQQDNLQFIENEAEAKGLI